jgi:Putative zinc-finger
MLTCKQASVVISASLDRPLTLRERLALKFHLFICKYCKRFSQQMQNLGVAIKQMVHTTETDETNQLTSAAKDRIAKLVANTIANG